MAVTVDVEALLAEAGPEAARLGREHVARGRVSDLAAVDGGVRASVADGGGRANVSVAIVGRTLVDDCDRHSTPGEELCEHAVALVMAARDAGITWTATVDLSGGSDSSQEHEHERELAEAATALPRTELVRLVVAQAGGDRLFAAKLLKRAGRLREAGPAELEAARRLVRDLAAIPDTRRQWELNDLARAGFAVADELDILAVGPASAELVDVVEEAIRAWDSVAGYLHDAWETYETEPAEVGERLADLHLELCEQLRPDPVRLGRWLAEMVEEAETECFLDAPEGYADVLGDEGFDAYYAALHG